MDWTALHEGICAARKNLTMSSQEFGQSEREDHPPDDSRLSKRRRISLACFACSYQKLKCDHIWPACTRCQKRGHAASCKYGPDAVEVVAANASAERAQGNSGHFTDGRRDVGTPGSSKRVASPNSFICHHALDTDDSAVAGLRARIYRLENRIKGLENISQAAHQHDGSHKSSTHSDYWPKHHVSIIARPEDPELMIFRGEGFQTQSYGASHPTSYLLYLSQLRAFMKEMVVQHPRLASLQNELIATQVRTNRHAGVDGDGTNLYQLLPRKDVVNHLVLLYIENFESTYRVLHLPSFFDEYHQCLEASDRARPSFVALLLVMVATVSCAKPEDHLMFRGDGSLDRENAARWVQATQSWVELQSQKHVTPIIFQIRCIILIAQQVNRIERKWAWTASGNLARIAIAAGLHRDTETVNLRHGNLINRRITLFEREMRRRIWTTIAELDLQTAVDRGMPAMIRDLIVDCGPPTNTDDGDFAPAMNQEPVAKRISEYTRSSFQNLSYSTIALRQELVSLINGPSALISYKELLEYDRKIKEALDDVPPWQNQDQHHGSHVSRTLLQLQLYQLQLLLHRPYVLHQSDRNRCDYSAFVHLRAAMSILDLHQSLLSIGNNIWYIMRSDLLTAVLSICFNSSIARPNVDRKLSALSGMVGHTDPVRYLENGLSMLETKINRLRVGIQEYFCVCSVIGLQKKQASLTTSIPSHEYQAADMVSDMIQKILSLQDNFSPMGTLASLPSMRFSPINGISKHSNVENGMPSLMQMDNTGLFEDSSSDLEGFEVSVLDLDFLFNLHSESSAAISPSIT